MYNNNNNNNNNNNLCLEIRRIWNMKCINIPAIVGADGNSDKTFKETFGSLTKKTVNRFTTKHRSPGNITHNAESAAV